MTLDTQSTKCPLHECKKCGLIWNRKNTNEFNEEWKKKMDDTKRCHVCKKVRFSKVFEGDICKSCITGERPEYKDKRFKIKVGD